MRTVLLHCGIALDLILCAFEQVQASCADRGKLTGVRRVRCHQLSQVLFEDDERDEFVGRLARANGTYFFSACYIGSALLSGK